MSLADLVLASWVSEATRTAAMRLHWAEDLLAQESQKILEPFLDLCVSSLRRGHANLLCIVPILSDFVRRHERLNFSTIYTLENGPIGYYGQKSGSRDFRFNVLVLQSIYARF